jgi:lipase
MAYRLHDVPVDGGILRVGQWGPADADSSVPTVIAVHGITASHLAGPWSPKPFRRCV